MQAFKKPKGTPMSRTISGQEIGRTRRPVSVFDYDIVHESLCSKSELDMGNGYHLCKKENIIPHTIELKYTDIVEKITDHRPDLLIASDSVRIQGIPLKDVVDGSYLAPRESFLDRFAYKPMNYNINPDDICCSD